MEISIAIVINLSKLLLPSGAFVALVVSEIDGDSISIKSVAKQRRKVRTYFFDAVFHW